MADLADGILDGFELARARRSPSSTRARSRRRPGRSRSPTPCVLLDTLDHAGALDLEALGANRELRSIPRSARPGPTRVCRRTLARLGALLDGSEVEARDLQDPLTFRTIAQQNGAARDAFDFVAAQLAIELNAAQSNPLVRRRRGAGDLGRQLRGAAARDGARLRAARSRPRDLDRGRALREAPAAAP